MEKLKTFEDLVFKPHRLTLSTIPDYSNIKHAVLDFDNGYSISVLFGNAFYSNGINTYEAAVLKDGTLCYDTPITNDVIGYKTKEEITEIMKQIQELPKVK